MPRPIPTEDFAETFAVWLKPHSPWRREYLGWPAYAKLEFIDALAVDIGGRQAGRFGPQHHRKCAA